MKAKTLARLHVKGGDGTLWGSLLGDALEGPQEGARADTTFGFLSEKGRAVHSDRPGRVMATLYNAPCHHGIASDPKTSLMGDSPEPQPKFSAPDICWGSETTAMTRIWGLIFPVQTHQLHHFFFCFKHL